MGEVFGKPKKPQKKMTDKALAAKATITEKDRAILNLKTSRDKLRKYQRGLDVESADLREKAATLVSQGKKTRALLLLKIRKLKEERTNEIDGQLYRLYEEIEKVESADLNVTILRAIEAGTKVMQDIQKEYSIERVEQLMEDSAEAIEKEKEISAMLSNSPVTASIDEAELEAELMDLGVTGDKSSSSYQTNDNDNANQYVDGAGLPQVPVTPILPVAPEGSVNDINNASSNHTLQENQQLQRQELLSA